MEKKKKKEGIVWLHQKITFEGHKINSKGLWGGSASFSSQATPESFGGSTHLWTLKPQIP